MVDGGGGLEEFAESCAGVGVAPAWGFDFEVIQKLEELVGFHAALFYPKQARRLKLDPPLYWDCRNRKICTRPGPWTPVTSEPSMSAVLEGPVISVMFGEVGSAGDFVHQVDQIGHDVGRFYDRDVDGGTSEAARPWLGLGRMTSEPVSATAA